MITIHCHCSDACFLHVFVCVCCWCWLSTASISVICRHAFWQSVLSHLLCNNEEGVMSTEKTRTHTQNRQRTLCFVEFCHIFTGFLGRLWLLLAVKQNFFRLASTDDGTSASSGSRFGSVLRSSCSTSLVRFVHGPGHATAPRYDLFIFKVLLYTFSGLITLSAKHSHIVC